MSYKLAVILSFSISIPAVIGWIRFQKINSAYYPFIFCIWIGLLNEIISYILIRNGYPSTINNNIYVLLEALLFLLLFNNLGSFQRFRFLFPLFIIFVSAVWIGEAIYLQTIAIRFTYFRIIYSFLLALISVDMINRQLVLERKNILKNSIFIICIANVIYYTFRVMLLAFQLFGINKPLFMIAVLGIDSYINLLSIIIFSLAILWMPIKHRFTLPS